MSEEKKAQVYHQVWPMIAC